MGIFMTFSFYHGFYHGFYIIHFHQGSFRFVMDISIVEMGKNKFQLVVS